MARRSMTRELTQCEAALRKRCEDRAAETDPDEYGTICEDIDALLDRWLAIVHGTARHGHG